MRGVVLLWAGAACGGGAWGDGFPPERLEIEIVPVFVESAGGEPFFGPFESAYFEAFINTHRAMELLGVEPWEYNIRLSSEEETLYCERATVLSMGQACRHDVIGEIADWMNFPRDLALHSDYLNANVRTLSDVLGTVRLYLVIRPYEWAWIGIAGSAVGNVEQLWAPDHHWTNTFCWAWTVDETIFIAHELGHCFGLQHNEDDGTNEFDLMYKMPTPLLDYLKESNRTVVQQHFCDDWDPCYAPSTPLQTLAAPVAIERLPLVPLHP